ncbi:MAG: helix-turn-helix transcriptional regulator [Acidimicrobiales bacterium]|nr:helix-turn-helix transcriptional regulator [Acidimicrobiales bacterium]
MDVAGLVHGAKESSGRSYRWLAAEAGVAVSTITRIESGRIQPTVEVLERILGACGYSLELSARPIGADRGPRLEDLVDAWESDGDRGLKLEWVRWRSWIDWLTLHPDRVPAAIYAPAPPSGNRIVDALLAAVAEKLADDAGLPRPGWVASVPGADPVWEPPARRRPTVDRRFAERGLIVDVESLFRPRETVGA